MMDNLPEIELKTEDLDQDDESEGFVISGNGHAHLNGTTRLPRPLLMSNQQQTNHQNRTRFPVGRVEQTNSKDWLEETIEFSSMLARQTQATLGRIKTDFLQSGMKFDADFRDHFLYIANNR